MRNKYIYRSRISEHKFRLILRFETFEKYTLSKRKVSFFLFLYKIRELYTFCHKDNKKNVLSFES